MMRFGQIDAEIAKCEEHLRATGTANTEVEFYLAQYLLVRLVAEYELRIKTLIQRRCARGSLDAYVKAYFQNTGWGMTRQFKIGDITGYLRKFGDDYAKTFADLVDAQLEQEWLNLYTNRHAVAHSTGAQVTLHDLKQHYQKTRAVVDAVVAALVMRPYDLRGLK